MDARRFRLVVGGLLTYARARGYGARVSLYRPIDQYWAPLSSNQTQNLTVSYTYDLPDPGRLLRAGPIVRGILDGWMLSGENAWVTGNWAGVEMSTVDGFDFTGGQEGARPALVADPELPRGQRDPLTGWFNTAAFARPSGRGDLGNTPRTVFRLPGVNNWNLAVFKNFAVGGLRVFQLRAEAYNVLNTIQFRDVYRTGTTGRARFDANGDQVNPNFGKASRSRSPRILQLSLRFTF